MQSAKSTWSKHKFCDLTPLEWNMKECKSSTHSHSPFSYWFYWFLLYAKRLINNIGWCIVSCFCRIKTISKTWRKLQFQFQNKLWVTAGFVIIFPENSKVIQGKGGWEQILLRIIIYRFQFQTALKKMKINKYKFWF